MATTTIQIGEGAHAALKQIAAATGQSLQEAVEQAIRDRRKQLYLAGLAADYASLRADAQESAQFDEENKLWDKTSADGLEGV